MANDRLEAKAQLAALRERCEAAERERDELRQHLGPELERVCGLLAARRAPAPDVAAAARRIVSDILPRPWRIGEPESDLGRRIVEMHRNGVPMHVAWFEARVEAVEARLRELIAGPPAPAGEAGRATEG